MALLKRNIPYTIWRNLSTNKVKHATADVTTITEKHKYYHRIGTKSLEDSHNVKPQGWNEAKPFGHIPGPKPLPLLGNMWRFLPGGEFFNVQLIDLHRRLNEEYGDLLYFSGIFGQKPLLFAYNPDDIEQALRNEGPWPIREGLNSYVYYRDHVRHDVFQGVGGILSVQGEEWFKFRSVVNKILMKPRTAEMFVDPVNIVANDLLKNIRHFIQSDPNHEMPESFQRELYKWTLESMGVIAFNTRIGCLDPNSPNHAEGENIIKAAVKMSELMYKLDVLPSLWRYVSTPNWRKYVKILDTLTNFNLKHIEQVLENIEPNSDKPDHEKSVLETLAQEDKKLAFAIAIDMMIAGTDTTGRIMASALYYLAKNPEVQNTLRKELIQAMPYKNSPVTKEMLRESPYLKAVIKETTRLAPISVGSLRTTAKDCILSGYQVPKGTDVLSITIFASSDEKHFKRAKEFIPDRWLRTNDTELSHKNTHPFVFLPFGFGPRSCIGKRLANLKLEVGIAKVIRNFQLSWNHPDAKFGTHLFYGIIDPIKIKMEEVES